MNKPINKKLSEEKFETHFCLQLEKNKYKKRTNENIQKELHIDFDLLEKFLTKTQEKEFENLKDTYSKTWKSKFIKTINEQLEDKELIQIIKDGIIIESTYEFKLVFTPNPTSFNKENQKQVESNIFSYVRQYKFDTESEKSIDIVLFLNGLVISTIELKYIQKGQDVYSAVDQYISRDLHLNIFNLPFLHIASDNDTTRIATKFYTKKAQDFMPFNKGIINDLEKGEIYRISYLYKNILTSKSILDLIRNFIFIDNNNKVIFPRFHQRRVVQKIIKDISTKFKKGKILNQKFLVEHSAGSGKSKSITWTAEQLKNLHINNEKVFDVVFIITDRKELNTQISKDFKKMTDGSETICYVTNSKELTTAIKNNEKVIIVILHNFSFINKEDLGNQKNKRICFLIDEQHRSHQGKLHSSMTEFFEKTGDKDMKLNFPNSVFIGFTATPSDKVLEKFGTKNENGEFIAYDTYSMEQAIKEGYILDVSKNVIPYRTLFKLRKECEDKLFEKEYNSLQLYKSAKKKAFEDKDIIKDKVNIILHYFKDKIQNEIDGKAKSMIVTSSRAAAIGYKILLDKEIKARGYNIKSLVSFSGKEDYKQLKIKDATETSLNNFTGDIAKEFKKDEYKFLIVADKYQTGFDEPKLFGMFLDKAIKEINAVQTLSRLNRNCTNKPKLPITVDFSNSYEEIQKAFSKFLKSRDSNKVSDYNELVALYKNILQKEIVLIEDLDTFELISNLDDNIFQTKFELLMNKIKDRYFKSDKITKLEFRKNLGRYHNSYSYMNTIINIEDRNILLLGYFSKQLYLGLAENDGSKQEIRDALDNLKIEKHKIVAVKKYEFENKKKSGVNKVKEREISKLSINEILELLGESFNSYVYSSESKKMFEKYLESIIKDKQLRNKILNSGVSDTDQTKQSVLKDLDKKIRNHFVMDPEGFKFYEKYSNSDIFERINEQAYFLIKQDMNY